MSTSYGDWYSIDADEFFDISDGEESGWTEFFVPAVLSQAAEDELSRSSFGYDSAYSSGHSAEPRALETIFEEESDEMESDTGSSLQSCSYGTPEQQQHQQLSPCLINCRDASSCFASEVSAKKRGQFCVSSQYLPSDQLSYTQTGQFSNGTEFNVQPSHISFRSKKSLNSFRLQSSPIQQEEIDTVLSNQTDHGVYFSHRNGHILQIARDPILTDEADNLDARIERLTFDFEEEEEKTMESPTVSETEFEQCEQQPSLSRYQSSADISNIGRQLNNSEYCDRFSRSRRKFKGLSYFENYSQDDSCVYNFVNKYWTRSVENLSEDSGFVDIGAYRHSFSDFVFARCSSSSALTKDPLELRQIRSTESLAVSPKHLKQSSINKQGLSTQKSKLQTVLCSYTNKISSSYPDLSSSSILRHQRLKVVQLMWRKTVLKCLSDSKFSMSYSWSSLLADPIFFQGTLAKSCLKPPDISHLSLSLDQTPTDSKEDSTLCIFQRCPSDFLNRIYFMENVDSSSMFDILNRDDEGNSETNLNRTFNIPFSQSNPSISFNFKLSENENFSKETRDCGANLTEMIMHVERSNSQASMKKEKLLDSLCCHSRIDESLNREKTESSRNHHGFDAVSHANEITGQYAPNKTPKNDNHSLCQPREKVVSDCARENRDEMVAIVNPTPVEFDRRQLLLCDKDSNNLTEGGTVAITAVCADVNLPSTDFSPLQETVISHQLNGNRNTLLCPSLNGEYQSVLELSDDQLCENKCTSGLNAVRLSECSTGDTSGTKYSLIETSPMESVPDKSVGKLIKYFDSVKSKSCNDIVNKRAIPGVQCDTASVKLKQLVNSFQNNHSDSSPAQQRSKLELQKSGGLKPIVPPKPAHLLKQKRRKITNEPKPIIIYSTNNVCNRVSFNGGIPELEESSNNRLEHFSSCALPNACSMSNGQPRKALSLTCDEPTSFLVTKQIDHPRSEYAGAAEHHSETVDHQSSCKSTVHLLDMVLRRFTESVRRERRRLAQSAPDLCQRIEHSARTMVTIASARDASTSNIDRNASVVAERDNVSSVAHHGVRCTAPVSADNGYPPADLVHNWRRERSSVPVCAAAVNGEALCHPSTRFDDSKVVNQTRDRTTASCPGQLKLRNRQPSSVGAQSVVFYDDYNVDHFTSTVNMASELRSGESKAKSMEILLTPANKAESAPPENVLQQQQQQQHPSGRQLSEHELRFQRSLRNLNTPDWCRRHLADSAPLRRDLGSTPLLGGGWSAFNSQSNSRESLVSSQCTTPSAATPAPHYRSSVSTPARASSSRLFEWRLSRENVHTPARPSPVTQSIRTRQPYLGWRSQERLSATANAAYQSPAERLASSIARMRSDTTLHKPPAASRHGSTLSVGRRAPPELDVHSSIRAVTSAIVDYFEDDESTARTTSARARSRCKSTVSSAASLGGANSTATSAAAGTAWMETAFVGDKPTDQPSTPDSTPASVLPDGQSGSTDTRRPGECRAASLSVQT